MSVLSSTSAENAAGTLTCTRQSRNDANIRSLRSMSGPPPLTLMSDTKSTELVSGRNPKRRRSVVDVLRLRRVAQPGERAAAVPHVRAALGHHVEEHAARRHGDVVRAGRDLDVLERVEVVVEARRANRRRVADVDAVQILRVLRAGRAARVVGALQTARCAADVRARDEQARHFVFDQRPDVAPARRALQQLFAQVDGDVGARGVDHRRRAGHGHRFGERRHPHRQIDAARSGRR